MLNNSKFAAAAFATLVLAGSFTASTEQAQAGKLNPAVALGVGVGVGLLAGAIIGSSHQAAAQPTPYREHRSFNRTNAGKRCWGRKTYVPEAGRCIDLEAQENGRGDINNPPRRKFSNRSGCPKGSYRNQNGVCQPNETGS